MQALNATVLIVPGSAAGDAWRRGVELAATIPAPAVVAWPRGSAPNGLASDAAFPATHLELPGGTLGERLERALTHTFDGCPILAFLGDATELPADTGADLLCSLILYDAAVAVSPTGRGIALALRVPPPGIGRAIGEGSNVDAGQLTAFLRWLGLSVAAVDPAAPADLLSFSH